MRFYNTLTRKKEEFTKPKAEPVKIYACGPTVYDFAHIGNLRTYINEDIFRRFLESYGYKVEEVMNITDIEDKIIERAAKLGISTIELTEKYYQLFLKDLEKLNIESPEFMPKATEEIDSMITLVSDLIDKGFAYKSDDGSIYFSIEKFKDYGKLAHLDFSGLKAGARIDQDEYDKENAQDFVLWKAKKDGEPSWKAPFGEGRPGWHIECSAMSMKYLGETIDIHEGAVDLIFPHHENEIAQSEASTGKKFVDLWFHGEHLMIEGKKMSKSLANIYTLNDLDAKFGISPLDFRMLCLNSHYRERLNLTQESMIQAQNTRLKLVDFLARLGNITTSDDADTEPIDLLIEKAEKSFRAALSDDLNMPMALAAIFVFIKELNKLIVQGISETDAREAANFIVDCDKVLGLGLESDASFELSSELNQLVADREIARNSKNWKKSDELRDKIISLGYDIEDTSTGQNIRKI
jgi:cysteinyl-tRNA synthetase